MKVLQRNEIKEEFKWNLDSLMPSDKHWEDSFAYIEKVYPSLADYQGKLKDKDIMLEALNTMGKYNLIIENLYVYAKMKKDEDSKVSLYQGMVNRIDMLVVKCSTFTSFVSPELTSSYSLEELMELSTNPIFDEYSYFFTELARNKKLIKSPEEEKIIAETSMISSGYRDVFSYFDNSDIKFKSIRNEDGELCEMSHSRYSLYLQSANKKVRKACFNSMFTPYQDFINTLTAVYTGNIKKDFFYAKIRGFQSCLDYSMYQENVPSTVYNNLIEAVHKAIPTLNKYLKYRKSKLGVKQLDYYDLYTPIIAGANMSLSFDDAYNLVIKALAPLGDEYVSLLKKARDDKWIDIYENKGKRSGAYSWGTYSSNPYILLNYTQTTHDIFTIAHELGHSIHSYYSHKNQPKEKASYEIFVAEVASTVNEVLLLKELLANNPQADKEYLLSYFIEMFRTTIFRQTMFAEFEKKAHNLIEQDMPISSESLCEIYADLNKLYYGAVVKYNPLIQYEWARIPHFYNSFYVYKYATGLTSAVYIASNILKGNQAVIDGYKQFLSKGGSMPPCDILRLAGVDLLSMDSFDSAFKVLSDTVDELIEISKKDTK